MTPTHRMQWLAGAFVALLAQACGPEYPNCDKDGDCHDGEYCVNKLCQQCRDDSDCGAGQACNAGACSPIEGYCTSSSDCGAGQECQNNTCVAGVASFTPQEEPTPTMAPACSLTPAYFAFDSSTIDTAARDQLSSAASCIKEKGLDSVHVTGMTDPRGTEEYNMALGDRRARSAKKYLEQLGVSAKVTYSSVGEEYASGEDEAGWAKDRRVEFKQR